MQKFFEQINNATNMHLLRKQFKMDEDPWDNYLIHDSKYIMPLLCHSSDLKVEEQILIGTFINQSIKEENISEYKLKASILI